MKIILIGDIIGQPGRRAVQRYLPLLKTKIGAALAIANVENLAGGFGVNHSSLTELKSYGVDVFTSGNHIWDKKEVEQCWADFPTLLRPCNYPSGVPGRGECIFTTRDGVSVGISNALGRVFFAHVIDDPFSAAMASLNRLKDQGARVLIMDFHAEATSEKIAMGKYLDGHASIVVGTHTHVPTADTRISKAGTAYQTDLGLTGGYGGVIGMKHEGILRRFLQGLPTRFEPSEEQIEFWALVVEVDDKTGKAIRVEQIRECFPNS